MPATEKSQERLLDLLEQRRDEILAVVALHHGRHVRVFGSVARGDDTADSDIDFLVDFDEDSSLFDLMHLSRALEEMLGTSVDVVSSRGLKPRDRRILVEAIDI